LAKLCFGKVPDRRYRIIANLMICASRFALRRHGVASQPVITNAKSRPQALAARSKRCALLFRAATR
jgi:hypothetical protein